MRHAGAGPTRRAGRRVPASALSAEEPVTVRFIHTADWQIGRPFGTVEREESRVRLRQQRIESVGRIAELVREREAAFVIVAGDLFDGDSPDGATVSGLCAAVGRIPAPVYVLPGNHDPAGPGSIYGQEFFLRQAAHHAPNMVLLLEPETRLAEGAVLLPVPCRFGARGEYIPVRSTAASLPPMAPKRQAVPRPATAYRTSMVIC